MKALSVKQPWAWLIVKGLKPIENRLWYRNYRGPLLIHASKGMTMPDYEACGIFVAGISDIQLPLPSELKLGGIVGEVVMVDCVTESDSPWFVGDFGWVFEQAKELPFRACKGALGLWECEFQKEAA